MSGTECGKQVENQGGENRRKIIDCWKSKLHVEQHIIIFPFVRLYYKFLVVVISLFFLIVMLLSFIHAWANSN